MFYLDMPEDTEAQRLEKDIAECRYCISGVCNTMRKMRVPQIEWGRNPVVKGYLARISKNNERLAALRNKCPSEIPV